MFIDQNTQVCAKMSVLLKLIYIDLMQFQSKSQKAFLGRNLEADLKIHIEGQRPPNNFEKEENSLRTKTI